MCWTSAVTGVASSCCGQLEVVELEVARVSFQVAVISLELESSCCDQLGVVVVISLKLLGGLARAQRVPATVRTEDGVQLCPP